MHDTGFDVLGGTGKAEALGKCISRKGDPLGRMVGVGDTHFEPVGGGEYQPGGFRRAPKCYRRVLPGQPDRVGKRKACGRNAQGDLRGRRNEPAQRIGVFTRVLQGGLCTLGVERGTRDGCKLREGSQRKGVGRLGCCHGK